MCARRFPHVALDMPLLQQMFQIAPFRGVALQVQTEHRVLDRAPTPPVPTAQQQAPGWH